jgi:hypothetical protein
MRMPFLHLTEEVPMFSIPKVVGVLSCGFLLCLGLSHAAQAENAASAADEMKADQPDHRQGGQVAGETQPNDPMKGVQSKGGSFHQGFQEEKAKLTPQLTPQLTPKVAPKLRPFQAY